MLVYQLVCTPVDSDKEIELSTIYRTEEEAIEAVQECTEESKWYHSFRYQLVEMNVLFMD